MIKAIIAVCEALAAYLRLRAIHMEQEAEMRKELLDELEVLRKKYNKAIDDNDTTLIFELRKRLSEKRSEYSRFR